MVIRVAIDATSLLGRPTGIGTFTAEVLRRLAGRDDLDLRTFAVTWRGRHALDGHLAGPAGASGAPGGSGPLGALGAAGSVDARAAAVPLPRRSPPTGRNARRRRRQPPMAARPLRLLWKRADRPPIEWWTGEVDVVWGPNFVVPPTRRAARVVSVHDLTPVRFPELCTRDTLDYPVLIRRAVAAGALVQTDSEAVAAEVRDWLALPSDRVVAVPLGVTPVAGGDPGRGRQRAGHDRYVLALGTVEPRKGLPTLVRAFDRAAADRSDLALVVAGPDGWGTAAFDAAVAGSAHAGRIRRLGWVDDDARADLLAGATCLAYPSLYEGFGLPPLEAMAAGVPVVTTDLAVLLEVTGDAAEHVPVGDVDALAEALLRLVDDEDRRAELRRRGRAQAARYSWDRCAEGIAGLLRRAADR